jgi:hypothetical protein
MSARGADATQIRELNNPLFLLYYIGMKKITILFLPVLTLCLLSSCSKDENPVTIENSADTLNFTYPVGIGSRWQFERQFILYNVRPYRWLPSYPVDTFPGNGSVEVLYDTVINSTAARCFLQTFTEDSSTYADRFYFEQQETKLLCLAYRSGGSIGPTPFKPSAGNKFQFSGKLYNNAFEIFHALADFSMPTSDSLIILDPPAVCLKYPAVTGKTWLFEIIGGSINIFKKYTSLKTVSVPAGTFNTIETQRIYPQTTEELYLYDYHSSSGQVMRDYFLKNILVTNEFGDPIGYTDLRDRIMVTSIYIAPEKGMRR